MKKSPYIRYGLVWRVKHYGPKVLRLGAFLGALYLVVLVFAGYEARAQVSESFLSMGASMLRYDEAERQEAPRTLQLNGQPIRLATGRANHSLDRVLDFYEERCLERDGRFSEQLAELVSGTAEIGDPDAGMLDATLRDEVDGRGYVACLDTGSNDRLEPEGLMERLRRFRRSLDVSDLGELRYVYAEEHDDHTFFVTFWVEGSFVITDMFPPEGDAPGRDVTDVPRPPDSRRILSAWEEGHPESVTAYQGVLQRAALERHFRRQMPESGWTVLEPDRELAARLGLGGPPEGLLVFEQGDRMVSVLVADGRDGLGTATIFEHR